MTISIVGRKCGMTRVFTPEGGSIPVTVIEALPNKITQIKKQEEKDQYNAIQVTTGTRKRSRMTSAEAGHYAKANVEPGRHLWEFRTPVENMTVGQELTVGLFLEGQLVDVTGISKGKGFAGCVKRWHFAMQDATHGNSLSHRAPGSIGQRQSPGKVFKGKKMSGHMGDVQRTILSQRIIKIDTERHLIWVSGSVPGAMGGDVIVRSAVKDKKNNEKHGGGR